MCNISKLHTGKLVSVSCRCRCKMCTSLHAPHSAKSGQVEVPRSKETLESSPLHHPLTHSALSALLVVSGLCRLSLASVSWPLFKMVQVFYIITQNCRTEWCIMHYVIFLCLQSSDTQWIAWLFQLLTCTFWNYKKTSMKTEIKKKKTCKK